MRRIDRKSAGWNDVEHRKEQGGGQQTYDRLQQRSDQRFLGQSREGRHGGCVRDRPVPRHPLLPRLEIGECREAAQGPKPGGAKCTRDDSCEHPGGQRPAGREAAQHPFRTKGQSNQRDDADHPFLVNDRDSRDRSG